MFQILQRIYIDRNPLPLSDPIKPPTTTFTTLKMITKRGLLALALLVLFCFSAMFTISHESDMVDLILSRTGRQARIWASISLCWGGRFNLLGWQKHDHRHGIYINFLDSVKVYGKGNFPYSKAAFYASLLWHNQTEGKVSL